MVKSVVDKLFFVTETRSSPAQAPQKKDIFILPQKIRKEFQGPPSTVGLFQRDQMGSHQTIPREDSKTAYVASSACLPFPLIVDNIRFGSFRPQRDSLVYFFSTSTLHPFTPPYLPPRAASIPRSGSPAWKACSGRLVVLLPWG